MKPELFQELYDELTDIKPSLEYCLAPKKAFEKSGASSLRAGVAFEAADGMAAGTAKEPAELDRHARKLYEWVTQSQSRIRMLMTWQSAGGLSYVASVHQRAVQCFMEYGNVKHEAAAAKSVSMEDFQRCIRVRHQIGDNGIVTEKENSSAAGNLGKSDFDA